ncbi:MAG: Rieske (2Fe-2S) protein, partial [Chloroflexota bacterium]|nr:Rieske (2Fe-2S) protein [Chloroflexota bacterium]
MSPGLALVGLSVIGTWGVASIAIIAAGVIMIFFPGEPVPGGSDNTLGGVFLLLGGLASLGLMQMVVAPLLGLDPPLPIPAKKIVPHERMKRWVSAGKLTDFPDGLPKEIRLRAQRVVIVRMGNRAYALSALCSHARLPLAGFPGSPIKPYPVQEECVTCPFHGA